MVLGFSRAHPQPPWVVADAMIEETRNAAKKSSGAWTRSGFQSN